MDVEEWDVFGSWAFSDAAATLMGDILNPLPFLLERAFLPEELCIDLTTRGWLAVRFDMFEDVSDFGARCGSGSLACMLLVPGSEALPVSSSFVSSEICLLQT